MEPSTNVVSIDKVIKFMKFDLEALKDSHNGYIKSQPHIVCKTSNVYYLISIFPNGNKDENRGNAYIFVSLWNGSDTNVESEIQIFIESANFRHAWEKGKGPCLGSTKKFFESNFFIDGEMVVKIKGTIKITLLPRTRYLISATWKVKESDLEPLKASINGCLRSKRFSISSESDVKYYIEIYPNGRKEEQQKQVWMYFADTLHDNATMQSSINISIETANYTRMTYDATHRVGGIRICSTEEFFNPNKRYFVDGYSTLQVTGTIAVEKESIDSTILSCEKGAASKAYQRHREKDFTIVADGKNIKVHKKVLIESSPVFEAMFSSGMKEVTEKKMELPDFTADIVEAALKLLYSDSIPTTFTFDQMLSLLQFSDKYDITIIKDLIQDYLSEKLSPTNVCSLINFTTTAVDAPKLLTKCQEYLLKYSKESKAIHDLNTVNKELLLKIFMGTFVHNVEVDSC